MTDPLHELIHSLTKSEKRYFTLLNSSEKITGYQRLFDALEEMEEYDELELRNTLAGQRSLNQLHVAKNYLYNLILRSLRGFHSASTPFIEFSEHIADMQILHAKGLFEHSKKSLKKARTIAEEYDDDLFRLLVLGYDRDRVADPVSNIESSRQTFDYRKHLLARLENSFHLKSSLEQLYDRIALRGPARGVNDDAMNDLLEQVASVDVDTLPFMPRVDYHSFKCYHHFDRSEYHEAAQWVKKAIELFDEHPLQRERSAEIYLSFVSNYFTCVQYSGFRSEPELLSYEGLIEALRMFDRISANTQVLKTRSWAARRLAEFEWAFAMHDNNVLRALLDTFEEELAKNRKTLSDLELSWFSFTIAKAYFWLEDYDKSLHWINTFLDNRSYQSFTDYYAQALILSLLIHYELGNVEYLPAGIKSVQRFFIKRETFYRFEEALIALLQKLIKQPEYLQASLSEFESSIEELKNGPAEEDALRFFEFQRWIDRTRKR